MSKTIEDGAFFPHPLQLDFFQPGRIDRSMNGIVHLKTVPYAIVVHLCEGGYTVRSQNQCEHLRPGDTAYIPANTAVEFTHHDNPDSGIMRSRWLHFRITWHGVLDFLSFYRTPVLLPAGATDEAERIITASHEVHSAGQQTGPARLLGNTVKRYSLAARMLELIVDHSEQRAETVQFFRKEWILPVLRYIREHVTQPIGVEELAWAAGYSVPRFHAVFRQEFGCGPVQYARKIRLETAARHLATGTRKLAAVAEMCGFADAFHLSHAFKAHYGISPREYQKQAALWLA